MYKKFIILLLTFSQTLFLIADEGMWLLSLLKKQEAAMQAKGLKLTAEDLYNVNQSSLKDAIVWFNGGCTGEIISSEGLVLTNHHCGYDVIASLSSTSDNILDDGFYAKTKADERKPKRPMFVSILVKMEDVTNEVLKELSEIGDETSRAKKIQELSANYKKAYGNDDPTLDVRLYEMFKGNQYFVFVYEKFTDIRLVGTPPQNVGKYGGDTDNWMWPRHTGDFSLFRIYANKDNKPADYSEENVPYKPKHHLPVSLKGVEEGDYAMIMGFPGRTNRYEFADAVQLSLDETNYSIVDMRNIRLTEWRKIMDKDLETRLNLSSQYARIANYWKYFIGQSEQLKRLNVVGSKKKEEQAFNDWAKDKSEYNLIIKNVSKSVEAFKPFAKHVYYFNEGIATPELMQLARIGYAIDQNFSKGENDIANKNIEAFKNIIANRDWNPLLWEADKKIFARILLRFYNDIPKNQHPELLTKIAKKFKFDKEGEAGVMRFANDLYKKSKLSTKANAEKFTSKVTAKSIKKDPAIQFISQFAKMYNDVIVPEYRKYSADILVYGRVYMKGLMEMNPDRNFYADANSSIRLTYGSVKGYNPKDAVYYNYVTTMDGVIEKYVPGDVEFNLHQNFIEMADKKKYGKYADKEGNLIVNFLSDNDITGGNSGSPVINGEGHLIGLAFDGNWEAMSGDIYYDDTYKRTINVDARYVLWCIDILGGAKHIVDEMTIIE